jgi:HK97 gp10 family phage protein
VPERAVEVVGLRELRRELKRAGEEFPKELRAANAKAAEVVAVEARRRAPRGPHQGGPKGRPPVPVASSIRTYGLAGKAQVGIGGSRTPHGQVLEFGGSVPRRGQSKALVRQQQRAHRGFQRAGLAVTMVKAQPYLYPAIAATREEVVDVYGAALDRLMRRAFPQGVA